MRIFITIAAIALAGLAVCQEKADLSPRHKLDSTSKYQIVVKIEAENSMEMKGTVHSKIAKAKDNRPIEAELKVSDMVQLMDGNDIGGKTPELFKTALDKHGLPERLRVQGNEAFYVALAVASYLPAKELSVGEAFKIDWRGKGGEGTLQGDGKLDQIKTENGLRVAVVKSKVSVTPGGEQQTVTFEVISEFNLADGSLIKSSMKGSVPEGAFSCSVALVK